MAEILIEKSAIKVPYKWSAGTLGSRFLRTVRDERRFLTTRCPECRKVFVPPRAACGTCFAVCEEGPDAGPGGVLLSFTAALYESRAHPVERPVYGLIRLDGADTAILHLVDAGSVDELKTGMRVAPVFGAGPELKNLGVERFLPERR